MGMILKYFIYFVEIVVVKPKGHVKGVQDDIFAKTVPI